MLFKTKKDKEFENELLIADTVAEIGAQSKSVAELVKQLNDSAFEAAKMDNDDYVNELVDMIADFEEFHEELVGVELEIKTCAITARVLSKLGKLPEALKACRAVFSNAPDFTSLGKEFRILREALTTARKGVRELRSEVSNKHMSTYEKIYGKAKVDDPKRAARVDNIRKGIEARLVSGVTSTQPAANSANDKVSASDEARIDAIAAMLDDERKGE